RSLDGRVSHRVRGTDPGHCTGAVSAVSQSSRERVPRPFVGDAAQPVWWSRGARGRGRGCDSGCATHIPVNLFRRRLLIAFATSVASTWSPLLVRADTREPDLATLRGWISAGIERDSSGAVVRMFGVDQAVSDDV